MPLDAAAMVMLGWKPNEGGYSVQVRAEGTEGALGGTFQFYM